MTYQEVLDYLYSALPMYQKVGKVAYTKTLDNIIALDEALGYPSKKFKSIHVAGTNGKGSCSHLLAAILQSAGYKVGLYTSPHLKSFTERIRINGQEVEQSFIQNFVTTHFELLSQIKPSFFEMTVAMAYTYFAERVDYAIIEVGLGGRLDSTNIIQPILSLITQISYDHQDILGETLTQIATEKAGIIKTQTPTIVSQRQEEVQKVFIETASALNSPLQFASDNYSAVFLDNSSEILLLRHGQTILHLPECSLRGTYQLHNFAGVFCAVDALRNMGLKISDLAIQQGFSGVSHITGLKGRWQILGTNPLCVADVAHNEGGLREVIRQIQAYAPTQTYIVLGVVRDKDLQKVLALLPQNACYIFCQANIERALDASILKKTAQQYGLEGMVIKDPNAALAKARTLAQANDLIFIGGSTFVVAEIDNL